MIETPEVPNVSVEDISAKLPVGVWIALYRAAARSSCIPIVYIRDAGRQFALIEVDDLQRLQRYWLEAEPEARVLVESVGENGGANS